MSLLSGIILLLVNIIVLIYKRPYGLFIFALFGFIGPNIYVTKDIIINYEVYASFFIILTLALSTKNIRISEPVLLFSAYIFFLVSSTIISSVFYGYKAQIISLVGYVRFIINLIIFTYYFDNRRELFQKFLIIILVINIGAAMLQLLDRESRFLFFNMYYKPTMTPLMLVMDIKYFDRIYGTFGSPIQFSFFTLIVYSYFICRFFYYRERTPLNTFMIIFSTILGFLALSKLFILGFILISLIVILPFAIKKIVFMSFNNLIKILIGLIVLFCLLIVAYVYLKTHGSSPDYYLKYILKPFDAFKSRYSGNLIPTIQVFKEHWIIGIGDALARKEFLGDSQYITILHNTGIIGMLIILFIFLLLFLKMHFQNRKTEKVLLICILVGGLAITSIFIFFTAIIISYCLAKSSEEEINSLIGVVKKG